MAAAGCDAGCATGRKKGGREGRWRSFGERAKDSPAQYTGHRLRHDERLSIRPPVHPPTKRAISERGRTGRWTDEYVDSRTDKPPGS